jgi:hypothetical protein
MSSVIQTTSRVARLSAFGLTLLPPCFLAVLVFTYSVDFPQWDQWGYVSFFEEFSRGSLTFSHLFAQVNEYRQFFPNLVFVTLGWLTRWDVRYEMWLLFLLACLISFNVYRLARLTTDGKGLRRLLLFFMVNLLIFSPSQYQNWLQGQQLVYYVPIACITTCILVAHSSLPSPARFFVCACLSTISTFSSANGGLCWVVVLPVLLTASRFPIPGRKWYMVAWLLAFLSNAALYLRGYHKPWWSPSLLTALSRPLQAVLYFLGFLGAPLGLERGKLAVLVGIILLSLFAIGCVFLLKFRCDPTLVRRMTPWMMVGAYSILTAGMTMIGRVGLGVGQSMNVRYIGYSVYLVVSLIFLVPMITDKLVNETNFPGHRLSQIAAALAILFLLWQPLIFAKGIHGMKEMRSKLLQAKASVLLIDLVPDAELVNTLYPDLSYLAAKANTLDELGFLRPRLVKSKRIQDFEGAKAGADVYGSLDHGETSGKMYVVSGIATLPYRGEAADAVILAYEKPNGDCIVFAFTHPKIGPSDPPFTSKGGRKLSRWQQSFSGEQLPFRPAKVTAWAFDANSAKAFRLDGNYVIQ